MKAKYQMTHPQALEVLGLQGGEDKKQLKSAYRAKAKEHHPDKGGDHDNFVIVKQAYDMLVEVGTTARVAKPVIRGVNMWGDNMSHVTVTITMGYRRWAVSPI